MSTLMEWRHHGYFVWWAKMGARPRPDAMAEMAFDAGQRAAYAEDDARHRRIAQQKAWAAMGYADGHHREDVPRTPPLMRTWRDGYEAALAGSHRKRMPTILEPISIWAFWAGWNARKSEEAS